MSEEKYACYFKWTFSNGATLKIQWNGWWHFIAAVVALFVHGLTWWQFLYVPLAFITGPFYLVFLLIRWIVLAIAS